MTKTLFLIGLFIVASQSFSLAEACTKIGQHYIHSIPGRPAQLKSDQCMYSMNQKYVAVLHFNGELAVHHAKDANGNEGNLVNRGRSYTSGPAMNYLLELQNDGNIVIYRNSTATNENYVWDADSYPPPSSDPREFILIMEDDGELVLHEGGPLNIGRSWWTLQNGRGILYPYRGIGDKTPRTAISAIVTKISKDERVFTFNNTTLIGKRWFTEIRDLFITYTSEPIPRVRYKFDSIPQDGLVEDTSGVFFDIELYNAKNDLLARTASYYSRSCMGNHVEGNPVQIENPQHLFNLEHYGPVDHVKILFSASTVVRWC